MMDLGQLRVLHRVAHLLNEADYWFPPRYVQPLITKTIELHATPSSAYRTRVVDHRLGGTQIIVESTHEFQMQCVLLLTSRFQCELYTAFDCIRDLDGVCEVAVEDVPSGVKPVQI